MTVRTLDLHVARSDFKRVLGTCRSGRVAERKMVDQEVVGSTPGPVAIEWLPPERGQTQKRVHVNNRNT